MIDVLCSQQTNKYLHVFHAMPISIPHADTILSLRSPGCTNMIIITINPRRNKKCRCQSTETQPQQSRSRHYKHAIWMMCALLPLQILSAFPTRLLWKNCSADLHAHNFGYCRRELGVCFAWPRGIAFSSRHLILHCTEPMAGLRVYDANNSGSTAIIRRSLHPCTSFFPY